jgi:thymidylate synthase (FAD)
MTLKRGDSIKVLDKGFVRLVDWMGDDNAIVEAARQSTNKGLKTSDEDKEFLRWMLSHGHTSPFEMVEFKFQMKLPIFVARQIIRHRTASVNELSGRYTKSLGECYVPNLRGEYALVYEFEQKRALGDYETHLGYGQAKEDARINLPLSMYTQWYWKMDLKNLMHFLKLRLSEHAQYETREYANAVYSFVKQVVPLTASAFDDYVLNSMSFSKLEVNALATIMSSLACLKDETCYYVIDQTLFEMFPSKKELSEFSKKILKLYPGLEDKVPCLR